MLAAPEFEPGSGDVVRSLPCRNSKVTFGVQRPTFSGVANIMQEVVERRERASRLGVAGVVSTRTHRFSFATGPLGGQASDLGLQVDSSAGKFELYAMWPRDWGNAGQLQMPMAHFEGFGDDEDDLTTTTRRLDNDDKRRVDDDDDESRRR